MSTKDVCEIYCYDEDKVKRIKPHLQAVNIASTAQKLKMIADETRLRIVYTLCQEAELCVCDIANIIGSTVANTSHHLRALHKQQVVKFRKSGKLAFYSLYDEGIRQLVQLVLSQESEEIIHV